MLTKVKAPDKVARTAMYYAEQQDFAYQEGAYCYLESVAMAPRMATLGAYIRAFAIKSVLDVGCGVGELVRYLNEDVHYFGIDIAPTPIHLARERYAARPHTTFEVVDFRRWTPPAEHMFDGVVWAGIGCTWTKEGRQGNFHDWSAILDLAERPVKDGGYLLLELVSVHWPALEQLVQGRYHYETGCDIDCIQSEESPKRSLRVFKKKTQCAW